MNQYIFIIGRNPLLSLAEITAIFPEAEIKKLEGQKALIHFKKPLENPQQILNRLGGTIKIGEPIGKISLENAVEFIQKEIQKNNLDPSKKILLSTDEQNLTNLLKNLKKILTKEYGYKVRYTESDPTGKTLQFSTYKDQLVAILASQDIRAYAKRDYEKPFRDPKSGMLPPKLAQIMINLAAMPSTPNSKKVLYDPFCGSGTILIEAALMEYDIIGSDIDPKAIEGAQKNLEAFNIKGVLFQKDATEIALDDFKNQNSDTRLPQKPDFIVTESYLGPFFQKTPTQNEIQKIQNELESLYEKTLTRLRLFQVATIIALPCHKIGIQYYPLPHIQTIIKKSGFTILQKFLYDRPEQKVAREIYVLQ